MEASEGVEEESSVLDDVVVGGQGDGVQAPLATICGGDELLRRHETSLAAQKVAGKSRK